MPSTRTSLLVFVVLAITSASASAQSRPCKVSGFAVLSNGDVTSGRLQGQPSLEGSWFHIVPGGDRVVLTPDAIFCTINERTSQTSAEPPG